MTLVFDTSVLSSLLANDDAMIKSISRQVYDRVAIPLATDAELRYGFSYGSKKSENLANYEAFKRQFSFEVVAPDQDVATIYADLACWARQHGVALSHNDIWIAATCIYVGGVLATTDGDFKYVPQVRLADL